VKTLNAAEAHETLDIVKAIFLLDDNKNTVCSDMLKWITLELQKKIKAYAPRSFVVKEESMKINLDIEWFDYDKKYLPLIETKNFNNKLKNGLENRFKDSKKYDIFSTGIFRIKGKLLDFKIVDERSNEKDEVTEKRIELLIDYEIVETKTFKTVFRQKGVYLELKYFTREFSKELGRDEERRLMFARAFAAEKAIYHELFTNGHLSERAFRDLCHSIGLEADALKALAAHLDGDFVKALDLLAACAGRVVVTGMGKSGHIAHKIAATLASTGAPAIFVHPGEASHGDLGMIQKDDAVIALSNSGETTELADLVAYAKRFELPLIGITGVAGSALAEAADVALVLPNSTEACPMGLAPTTSTTVMLALGDAIAVALLERKGFSPDDFHMLHPGGKLGRRLLKVSDIMHDGDAMPLVAGDAPMSETLVEMTAKSLGCVGVVDAGGRLEGVITDGDLRRHMSAGLLDLASAEVMTRDATTIRPDALASEAVHVMNTHAITNLFVSDNGRPVGVLHIHDCLRAGVA